MTPDPEIRVAVLLGGEYVQQWERNALTRLVAAEDVRITHLVVNAENLDVGRPSDPIAFLRGAIERVRQYPLWSIVGLARQLAGPAEHERPVHVDTIAGVADATRIVCSPRPVDEHWNRLPDETVERLEDVDVAVRFGFGLLTGEILRAPRYGVLSFHAGDIRSYRGQPGGFWEFVNGDDEVGVTVQRLNDTLDGGEIAAIETIDVRDANTWQEVRRRALWEAERLLVPAVRTLVDPGRSVVVPDELGTLYTVPRGWAVLAYLYENTRGRMRSVIDRAMRSLASTWRANWPIVVALAFGALVAGSHPLFTHHRVTPIHVEWLVGLLLLTVGVALFDRYDGPAVSPR